MLAAVVAFALILTGIKHAFFLLDNRPRDMLLAMVSVLSGHSTIYARGYSESKFRSLRVGMTPQKVEEIMGPPLAKGQWQESIPGQPITPGTGTLHELWRYSRAGKLMGNYWEREVWFKDGVVHCLKREYYVD
jgi:hypothetical protein